MRQIVVLSGKGGTGKTTVASSIISLLSIEKFADCDVEAPNLHLVNQFSKNKIITKDEYFGLPKANVENIDSCISCGKCESHCRFNAITIDNGMPIINEFACEGCGVCVFVCDKEVISLKKVISGYTKIYTDIKQLFSTAQLKMGEGASGKLVTEVKNNLKIEKQDDIIVIDGSPGIGCPVIASVSGADYVLLVSEPTLSGISDLKRIVDTSRNFQVPVLVCINKYDISEDYSQKIKEYCNNENILFLGEIPYDKNVSKCVNNGNVIVESNSPASIAIQKIIYRLSKVIGGN